MNRAQDGAYEAELKRVARQLDLARTGDIEARIIGHCLQRLRSWVAVHGKPRTLSDLANAFATSLDMQISEVRNHADIDAISEEVTPVQKAVIEELRSEFGEDTDAVTVLRLERKPWEQAYWAIINCQGWHAYRRYFSKWHEIVHRLLEGQQLSFAFRQTKAKRPEPEEVLVDRVAARLAFYPDMFAPVVREEYERGGRLTFASIDRVRERIAPEASREATIFACLPYISTPVWFLQCCPGFKASEERQLNNPQMPLFPLQPPKAKLRVRAGSSNRAAENLDIRFHPNMRVPGSSIVAQVFHDSWGLHREGVEAIDDWETSVGGPIGSGEIHLEAERTGNDEVWAIAHLC